MKKLLALVVTLGFAAGMMTSCKKDDPAPVDPIVGAWALKTYKYTDLPPGYTRFEGFETPYVVAYYFAGVELGYTIIFNSDGTYSRAYTVNELQFQATSIYDKGKWTKDGTNLKLTPNSTTDLGLIESYGGTPGTAFTISGDITDVRMTLSLPAVVGVFPDTVDLNDENTSTDDLKGVDATVLLIFNKL